MGDDLVTWLRAQFDMREKEIALIAKLANAPEEHTRMLLAEVDAKRRIIEGILAIKRPTRQQMPSSSRGTHYPARPVGPDPRPHLLALLALPYADRPGYRDEWRPVT